MKSFARTPPRLHWVFSRSPLFFVTFCTYSRRSILARAEVHAAFIEFADRAHREFGIAVGRYVILPDHIHLFVAGPDDFNLGKWVGTLKRVLGGAIATRGRIGLTIGAFILGLIVVIFGLTQTTLLPGAAHWVIQIIHLLLGLAAIGLGEAIGGRYRRLSAIAG